VDQHLSSTHPTVHSEIRNNDKKDLVGIYAICVTILIFIFAQTLAGGYWSGGISRGQESQKESIQQLQQKLEYLSAQYQILATTVAEMQGLQNAEKRTRK
jgi:cell division protein FtsB